MRAPELGPDHLWALVAGSLDPLESRSRLGLWVQGGMQENIAIAGFERFIGRGSSLSFLVATVTVLRTAYCVLKISSFVGAV